MTTLEAVVERAGNRSGGAIDLDRLARLCAVARALDEPSASLSVEELEDIIWWLWAKSQAHQLEEERRG